MTLAQSVATVFRKYADFSGRARRSEYWWWYLAYVVVEIVLFGIGISMAAGGREGSALQTVGVIVAFLAYIVVPLTVLLPNLAVTARRLHDRNMSGWMQLLGLIPFAGFIIMIVLLVADSDPGPNQFGPNPKDPNAVEGPYGGYDPYGAGQAAPYGSAYGSPQGGPQDRPYGHDGGSAGPVYGQAPPTYGRTDSPGHSEGPDVH